MNPLSDFFYPDLYVSSVYAIPYKRLREKNIGVLLFDVDNTLKPHYQKEPPENLKNFFSRLEKMGFTVCLVSNAPKKRVAPFAGDLGVKWVCWAKKPLLMGVNKAKRLCRAADNAAIIGDQIFTDVLAGKRGKLYTILVKPISKKESVNISIKRFPERLILRAYKKYRRQSLERF